MQISLNTVTVREKWGLPECIEGAARHGIPGIAPWRDVLQAMGVEAAARRIRVYELVHIRPGVCMLVLVT